VGLAIDAADRPVIAGYIYSGQQYNFMASRFLAETAESDPTKADDNAPQDWPDVRQMQKALTPELIEHARARAVGAAPPRPVSCLAISPSGNVLATCSWQEHSVRVLDVASGRELAVLSGHQAEVMGLAFSPDGRCLATAGQDALVRVWDAQNWKLIAELAGHTLPVQAVAFSSDGQMLASAGKDGARIWRRSDFQQVMKIGEHTGLSCIAFSPDGTLLATGSRDKSLRLWQMPEVLFERLCRERVGRNLTAQEWEQHIGDREAWAPTCAEWPSAPELLAEWTARQDQAKP